MTDDQILIKFIRECKPELEQSEEYLAYYMKEKLKEVYKSGDGKNPT